MPFGKVIKSVYGLSFPSKPERPTPLVHAKILLTLLVGSLIMGGITETA